MREDWVEIELGEVCKYSKGKKPKVLKKEYSEITPFPYVNIKAFEKGIFEEYTDGENCNLCNEGDLLMVWDGARAGLTGKAKKGAIGSTLMKIEPMAGIDKNYLFYFLLSLYKKLNTNPRGVGIPHVEPRLLWDSIFLMPDIPTQRAILTKIENLFTSLDKGIADLKKAQEQLKVYRQAVLKKAFEGELTREWRENHVSTGERLSKDNTTIPMAAEPIVNYKKQKEYELPDGWMLVRLGEVCNSVEYGTSTKSSDIGKIPVLRMGNIQNGRIDWVDLKYTDDDSEIEKYRLNHNDVLFNRTNSAEHVGKTAIYKGEKEAIFAGYLIRINYKSKVVNPDFLNYYLNSHEAKQYGNRVKSFGVNQSNINGTKLKKYPFPFPQLEEQHQIVREIESRLSVCDQVEQNITEGLEKSEALRQSILKKAFEGRLLSEAEVNACKQEADYEPASVLLEKIKKEKEKK